MNNAQKLKSQNPDRLQWALAQQIARDLVKRFSPLCERVEICGSLRRMSALVGDIELLVCGERGPLFDDVPGGRLDEFIAANPDFVVLKRGPKFKQFEVLDADNFRQVKIDLFCVDADCFGYHKLLRTGPDDFSRLAVSRPRIGGWLRDQFFAHNGEVLDKDGKRVVLREEEDFFKTCLTIPWIEPHRRQVFADRQVARVCDAMRPSQRVET